MSDYSNYKPYPDGVVKRIVKKDGKWWWQREGSPQLEPYTSIDNVWPGARNPRSVPPPQRRELQQNPLSRNPQQAYQGGTASTYPTSHRIQSGLGQGTASTGYAAKASQLSTSPPHPRYELEGGKQTRQNEYRRGEKSAAERPISLSNLPKDLAAFIEIPRHDFAGCIKFLDKHPNFLMEVPSIELQDAAIHAIRTDKPDLMHRCVQRLVIIHECRKLTKVREQKNYLQDLVDGKTRNFYAEVTAKTNSLTSEAQPRSGAAESEAPAGPKSDFPKPNSVASLGGAPPALAGDGTFAGGVQPNNYSYHITRPVMPSPFTSAQPPQFSYGNSPPSPSTTWHNPISAPTPWNQFQGPERYESSGTGYPISGSGVSTAPYPRTSNTWSGNPQSMSPPEQRPMRPGGSINESEDNPSTVGGGEKAEIRPIDDVDVEIVDPRYMLRNGYPFFHPGRVFSVMSPELLGINPGQGKKLVNDPNVITGPKGEKIYCKRRPYVVIRRRRGYSVCVPINSYQSRGVKKGSEKAAHSIVYPSHLEVPPAPLPGETGMTKEAIAVVMHGNATLDPASRIHFGKVTSIDWNVKVMDLGVVANRSMPYFEAYWKHEGGRSN